MKKLKLIDDTNEFDVILKNRKYIPGLSPLNKDEITEVYLTIKGFDIQSYNRTSKLCLKSEEKNKEFTFRIDQLMELDKENFVLTFVGYNISFD